MRRRNATLHSQQVKGIRRRWAPGLLSLFAVLALAGLGVLHPLEQWIYRQTLNHFAPEPESEKITVLTLSPDETGVQRILAQALERLTRATAVGVMLPLTMPENGQALSLIQSRLEQNEIAKPGSRAEPLPTLHALAKELDSAAWLARALKKNANVILGVPFLSEPQSDAVTGRRWDAGEMVTVDRIPYLEWLPSVSAPSIPGVRTLAGPYENFVDNARGVGLFGGDSVAMPALFARNGELFPSLLLQLMRLNNKAFTVDQTSFLPEGGIALRDTVAATDLGYRFYPFARGDGELEGISRIPLTAVAAGEYPLKFFSGKTVLIGVADDPAPLRFAGAVAALLQQRLVTVPMWSVWGRYAVLAAVALLVMGVLPRMGYVAAAVTVLLTTLLLINGEFLLLVLSKQWLPLMLPLLLLWLSYPLMTLRRYLTLRNERLAVALSEANRELGRILHSQGDLDLALERYRLCRIDERLLDQLYHLGLDFERKRRFGKAVSVFQYLDAHSWGYRDAAERIQRNQSMDQRIVLAGGGAATAEGTVIMSAEGLQNPTVGHYQIEREIGRGAMGMVYLGKDPRIGRPVAIKTMALSSEFEGMQLDEIKARFYREAETAGRLNHPNIVHIYDIGEEQELAYIAMDYLRGKHLGNYTAKETLLPIKEVLGIIEKVAEALDYAHKQNVVHRDIKPANIIFDREEGSVKVTDFGVACLTDSSKTKTGTVLGSPSYMSPEQVAGKRVDGRADIFSLGVTLYQMVTAHLPFAADSLGSLMYKIANEPHPKPSKFRKGLPSCLTRIINKCLQKDPQKRYQSGGELAAALKRCREK